MNGFEPLVPESPRTVELAAIAQTLEGRFPAEAGAQLQRLASLAAVRGHVVELCHVPARSALWLAAGTHERGARLVVVDDSAPHADGDLLRALAKAGLDDAIERRRAHPAAAAHAWDRGISISLLHIARGADYAPLREAFELWSRFVVDGGIVVLDGVPTFAGPSRLMHELPRWWRYYSATNGKWLVVKANEPWPARL